MKNFKRRPLVFTFPEKSDEERGLNDDEKINLHIIKNIK